MVPAAETLQVAWEGELAKHGLVASVGTPVTAAGPGGALVKVPVHFEHGAPTVAVGLAGEQGWITGIQVAAAQRGRTPAGRREDGLHADR
jgi:hypothetical protein